MSGIINLNGNLSIGPNYTFDDFRRTKYYKNDDGIRIIYIEEVQIIDDQPYKINLFFKDGIIYMISLVNCSKSFSEKEEPKRKLLHDRVIEENGIQNGKMYKWGRVLSEYDPRSNLSSIDVFYA